MKLAISYVETRILEKLLISFSETEKRARLTQ